MVNELDDNIKRLADKLDKEVDIRDRKIGTIYEKMDEHFLALDKKIGDVLKCMTSKPSGDWKMVAVLVAFLSLAFGLVENQIMTDAKIANKGFEILSASQKENTATLMHYFSERAERSEDEVLRIREWKDATEDMIPRLDVMIKSLKEQIDIKSADRFTGTQGMMMQKQLDRFEDRLTFLTKSEMLEHSNKGM